MLSTHREESHVEAHYEIGNLEHRIVDAVLSSQVKAEALRPEDFAGADEFHIRGRASTVELASFVPSLDGAKVLDIGCGIGGTARYLATEHGCEVIGVDLTETYCEVANSISERLGVTRTSFSKASALDLPFPDSSFDVVWTEHVQMNVADKHAFYSEATRVLRPGGALVFHDVFEGSGEDVLFPVPWANESSISFLVRPEETRSILEEGGLRVETWLDSTEEAATFFSQMVERVKTSGPPPVGLHLIMGESTKPKLINLMKNLAENRVSTIEAVFRKSA